MPPAPDNMPSTGPSPVVVGIGAATWDRFMIVPELPGTEGVTQSLGSTEQGGGPVATALCTLAALGQPAELLDVQGDDPLGETILSELSSYGVRTRHVVRHSGAKSAHAQILVREIDGARHIIFSPSTASELGFGESLKILLSKARLLHLNGRHEAAAREGAAAAKASGVTVSFDGGAGRYRDSIRDLVLASDLRILAKDFSLQFTKAKSIEAAATTLLSDSPRLLVITDGLQGSWIWPRHEAPFHCPAFPVADVVDTTGCGDVYHGAFLHGWLCGWPLRKTARFASLLAAETARSLGGRTALRTTDFAAIERRAKLA
ncbi:MAG TPA: PfkB family carbohydrate kinase [Verrucomicrobium sp.]|nr:PfkB family carbohydrate kinase [Verrucomicrobium sp.]